MVNTLDDVIRTCTEKYGLKINRQNKEKYIRFLKRQQIKHHYNLNYIRTHKRARNPFLYLNVMVDKLLLFSYLIGKTTVIAGYKDHTEKKE